jgi:hypothetical protein
VRNVMAEISLGTAVIESESDNKAKNLILRESNLSTLLKYLTQRTAIDAIRRLCCNALQTCSNFSVSLPVLKLFSSQQRPRTEFSYTAQSSNMDFADENDEDSDGDEDDEYAEFDSDDSEPYQHHWPEGQSDASIEYDEEEQEEEEDDEGRYGGGREGEPITDEDEAMSEQAIIEPSQTDSQAVDAALAGLNLTPAQHQQDLQLLANAELEAESDRIAPISNLDDWISGI